MTEPVNNKTLGGLTYNANLVKSAKKLSNGTYEIIFKSGEKLTYPEQKPFVYKDCSDYTRWCELRSVSVYGTKTGEYYRPKYDGGYQRDFLPRNARIEQSKSLIWDDSYFTITNIMGAKFTTAKDTECHVTLKNSSNTTIDLAANKSKWFFGDDATVEDGANNRVILDKHDSASISPNYVLGRVPGESYYEDVDGEGVAAQKDIQGY